jgi:hypothetical protein
VLFAPGWSSIMDCISLWILLVVDDRVAVEVGAPGIARVRSAKTVARLRPAQGKRCVAVALTVLPNGTADRWEDPPGLLGSRLQPF